MTATPSVPTGTSARPRVLVVDDEPPIVELVRGYLRREGWEVLTVADGPAAIAAVREHAPDVVVLDLMLPGLDGVEVCRQLRTFSDVYVIMLTARGEEIDRVVGLSVGADDYLVKPFSPRELVARIKALLRRPRTPAIPAQTHGTGVLNVDAATQGDRGRPRPGVDGGGVRSPRHPGTGPRSGGHAPGAPRPGVGR